MIQVLLVAMGGAVGSLARFGVGVAMARWLGLAFPWGTLTVNILGGLAMGLLAGLASAAVLVAWLRRGAPTSPERAGWITGIAAGSLGMFAFSLYCPDDSIYHIGLWHSASVIVAALLGRLIVPRLIRW